MANTPNPYEAPAAVESRLIDPGQLLDGRLRTTGFGLKTIHAGILTVLFAYILFIPLTIFVGALIPAAVLAVVVLFGFLLINLGPLLCLTAPSGVGLRSWVVATVVTQALALVASLGMPLVIGARTLPLLLGSFTGILPLVLFLVFLYRLSWYIGRDDLARRTRNVFGYGGVMFVGVLAAIGVDYSSYTNVALITTVTVIFLAVFWFVSYANLVNALGDAIRNPHKKEPLVGIG